MRYGIVGTGAREFAIAARLVAEGYQTIAIDVQGKKFRPPTDVDLVRFDGAPDLLAGAEVDVLVVQDELVGSSGLVDIARSNGMITVGPTQAQSRAEANRAFLDRPTIRLSTRDEMRECFESTGPLVLRPRTGRTSTSTVIVESSDDLTVASRLLDDAGEAIAEPKLEGLVITAYATVGQDNTIIWSPALRSFPFRYPGSKVKTGGMGAYTADVELTEACAEVEPFVRDVFAKAGSVQTFVGIEMLLSADGPQVIDLDFQLGNPETSTLLASTDMDFGAMLLSMGEHGIGIPWGASLPTVSLSLATPEYPSPQELEIPRLEHGLLRSAGLTVDLGEYDEQGDRATAGPSRPAVLTARGGTLEDAASRLKAVEIPMGLEARLDILDVRSSVIEELLSLARHAGRAAEDSRLAMMAHARRRQAAVLSLTREHRLSVRQVATELGCSPSVVQRMVQAGARLDRADSASGSPTPGLA